MKHILVIIFTFSSFFVNGQDDAFLVKPYLQFATKTSINVLWETHEKSTSTVLYGEARLDADKPTLDLKVTAKDAILHEVEITGLKPATKYLYQTVSKTADGKIIKSKVYTFKTNVNDDDAYFFALVGDSQHSHRSPGAWGKIAEWVWKDRPNFIVHAGDLVDVGTRKEDWTKFFFPQGHVAMSRFPMYTVLGNHEQDAQYYYDYMVSPAPEYYYTFKYGNAQFFMIDTNKDVSEGSEQFDWLEWELSKSDAFWKFVIHHHPPYSSEENDHGDTYKGASSHGTHARNLVPLYETYGVDFCLFGHTHVYERTWPLMKNKVNVKNGVTYINSGGAGGGLEDFDPVRSWFTKELQTGHHYCTFAVFENHLSFKAIDMEGHVFDVFELVKEADKSIGMIVPPAPHFDIDKQVFTDQAHVKLIPIDNSLDMYYTNDGTEPTKKSLKYKNGIKVDKSCELKTRCYTKDGKAGRVVTRKFLKMKPQPATDNVNTTPGLTYKYYEGKWKHLPNFDTLNAIKSGIVNYVNISETGHRENEFGIIMEGYLEVPKTDTYTLYTYSDDGSKLYINDQMLVDSDGLHSAKCITGTTILEKGKHKIRIEYFEGGGNNFMKAGYFTHDNEQLPFSSSELSHKK